MRYLRLFIAMFAILVASGCSKKLVEPPQFDGKKAMEYLVAQVDLGPRVPASAASAACRALFENHLTEFGLSVDSQQFEFFDPYSKTNMTLTNFIGSETGDGTIEDRIVIMAHYDSRPRTDYAKNPDLRESPIDGANDGASGCAVLMELARAFKEKKPPGPVDLVFVDGEDWGRSGDHDLYMIGSREFSRRGIREKYRFGIVVDMIGDRDQQIYREMLSQRYAPAVNDMVWEAAGRLGVTTFIDSSKYQIQDDHLALNIGGVPTIDIIDFDYPYWHTEFDSPDKCSAEALTNVGKVVLEVIYNYSLWPQKK
ncbi:MAG: M28 family peptidase [bacterium]|nr:M28 family peptidase [bacterium]